MKLIKSKTELDIREQLLKSNTFFQSPSRLKSALEEQGHSTAHAFTLNWTPEQNEDIYLVLVDGAYLVKIELDRVQSDSVPVCERIEIADYKHQLKKMKQIELLIAQDLAHAK